MKSQTFSAASLSILLIAASAVTASACGPYNPIIPTPEFFGFSGEPKTMADYDRSENLQLWQQLTSERIPLRDIEEVVYRDSYEDYRARTGYDAERTNNLFYIYLHNSNDEETEYLLELAKELEKRRNEINSPWYYPQEREYFENKTGDFYDIIEACNNYKGKRLKDRFSLQTARALFASRLYGDCIEYVDSAFADIPDSNLMKRMAQRYAAGCLTRLGDVEQADSLFAVAGDIWSVTDSCRIALMARLNPGAPQFIDYIRSFSGDSAFMCSFRPMADKLLKDKRVRNKGDWHFLSAYIDKEFKADAKSARKEIHRAVQQRFSTDELRDLAKAYRMKLAGPSVSNSTLLSDMKWLESKMDVLNPDAAQWIRRCQNIIYVDYVPQLWKREDYSTAILLSAYADNLRHSDYSDYGCLSFRLMCSLTSAQLADVYARVNYDSCLYSFLRRKARTDRDYYYELIGTLALREENYTRAVRYLSMVSDSYVRTTNIYKGGYLSRDPFFPYRSRWETYTFSDDDVPFEYEYKMSDDSNVSYSNTKLSFARKMADYKRTMLYGRSGDERGMARLMYAIGRRNSFEECWALTQYWRGFVGIFEPVLNYGEDASGDYSFLYDYDDHAEVEKLYNKEVDNALAMIKSDEIKAEANYTLRNLKTVVRLYGDTPVGRFVKTSCDSWESWL